MKKLMSFFVVALVGATLINLSAFAGDKRKGMDHSGHVGEKIHESEVEGYQFAYHLLNMKERNTHHMMVYITSPDGQKVENAKVGFLVTGPDKTKQKLMTMGMKGAYGADLKLNPQGSYTVKMKAVAGDKKLFDEFIYQAE